MISKLFSFLPASQTLLTFCIELYKWFRRVRGPTATQPFSSFYFLEVISWHAAHRTIFTFSGPFSQYHFHRHATKKINRPVEEAKKMRCYKRLIYKQFVQVSGLCGPQFLSNLLKRCMETPYWCTVLVPQYGRWKSAKTSGVHFFYKSPFFSLENKHT